MFIYPYTIFSLLHKYLYVFWWLHRWGTDHHQVLLTLCLCFRNVNSYMYEYVYDGWKHIRRERNMIKKKRMAFLRRWFYFVSEFCIVLCACWLDALFFSFFVWIWETCKLHAAIESFLLWSVSVSMEILPIYSQDSPWLTLFLLSAGY